MPSLMALAGGSDRGSWCQWRHQVPSVTCRTAGIGRPAGPIESERGANRTLFSSQEAPPWPFIQFIHGPSDAYRALAMEGGTSNREVIHQLASVDPHLASRL